MTVNWKPDGWYTNNKQFSKHKMGTCRFKNILTSTLSFSINNRDKKSLFGLQINKNSCYVVEVIKGCFEIFRKRFSLKTKTPTFLFWTTLNILYRICTKEGGFPLQRDFDIGTRPRFLPSPSERALLGGISLLTTKADHETVMVYNY